MKTYNAKDIKRLYRMLRSEFVKDSINGDDLFYKVIDFDGKIKENEVISEDNMTVKDLFELYDSFVPVGNRLFHLEYDAYFFQGIFTIDGLIEKLEHDGYFEDKFWGWYRIKDEARKNFEKFKLHDSQNIAYELLWAVQRIV